MNKLTSAEENVLVRLSEWKYDENNLKHQIGFLAQNLLDNSCKTFCFFHLIISKRYVYMITIESNIQCFQIIQSN